MHEAQDPCLPCCFLASSSWFTSKVVRREHLAPAACVTLVIALVLAGAASVPAPVLTQVRTWQGNVSGLAVALHGAEAV